MIVKLKLRLRKGRSPNSIARETTTNPSTNLNGTEQTPSCPGQFLTKARRNNVSNVRHMHFEIIFLKAEQKLPANHKSKRFLINGKNEKVLFCTKQSAKLLPFMLVIHIAKFGPLREPTRNSSTSWISLPYKKGITVQTIKILSCLFVNVQPELTMRG